MYFFVVGANIFNKNKKDNLEEASKKFKIAYMAGILLIVSPIFIKLFNLYGRDIKNLYLLCFEYFLSGIIFLLVTKFINVEMK